MQYENTPVSQNIEDRRGQGGGGGMMGGGGLGIVGIIAVFAISYFTGINPAVLMGGAEMASRYMNQGGQTQPASTGAAVDPNDPTRKFLAHVMGTTEAVWTSVLPQQTGLEYTPATLVIYDGATRSGCGGAQAAMGPFYCPIDKKVYLDTSFFRDMTTKYGGGGDFAYAYVVAHEIGHHVQDLLGILDKADAAKQRSSQTQANAISVRIELQADCLAGVWAANANQKWQILEQGDVEKALATAQAIGDDRLQTAARGYAVPDSFTHGSSAQRAKWLTTGLKSGQISSCDTFSQ
ncbi:KPN_02809 family neutral zinc metallopeptidase [Roseiarcus sp.]|uniref:KPN_02809 family neutral zinc metallopeptidase n=1 Tax=Roseiarcus sp. TaxID=1969460 RepID=UPI003F9A0B96